MREVKDDSKDFDLSNSIYFIGETSGCTELEWEDNKFLFCLKKIFFVHFKCVMSLGSTVT